MPFVLLANCKLTWTLFYLQESEQEAIGSGGSGQEDVKPVKAMKKVQKEAEASDDETRGREEVKEAAGPSADDEGSSDSDVVVVVDPVPSSRGKKRRRDEEPKEAKEEPKEADKAAKRARGGPRKRLKSDFFWPTTAHELVTGQKVCMTICKLSSILQNKV